MTNRIPKLYGKKEKKKGGFLSAKKKKNKKKNNNNNNNKNKNKSAHNNKKKQKKEEDPMFQRIPSKTGTTKTAQNLSQLTQELVHFKDCLLKTNIIKDPKFFLNSVDNVMYMLDLYCKETESPPFNWKSLKISSHHAKEAMSKYAESGFKVLNCGIVLPIFDAHGLAQANSGTGSETGKADAPWFDANRKLPQSVNISLNEKEQKIWLEFADLDKGNPEVEVVERSIELDNPVVSVIGDFVVAAFNEACEMFVKKDEHNNLHDFEFMECKYLKITHAYIFNMTIEAIEEGNLGVYETQVVCTSDGSRRTLTKFVLTDRKPVGTRAMAISHFSCLRSLCKVLEDVTDEKVCELKKIIDSGLERRKHGLAMYRLYCLLEFRTETINGLLRELSLGLNFLFSPDCCRTTNPDVWSHPENCFYSVMVRRSSKGYDYHKPLDMAMSHYVDPFGVGKVNCLC